MLRRGMKDASERKWNTVRTVYSLSICTSLKCMTFTGSRPLLRHTRSTSGLSFGKGTCHGTTGGSVHIPKTASQNLVAVSPNREKWRRSWARIGPCVRSAPSQTSLSSIWRSAEVSSEQVGWRRRPGRATHLEVYAHFREGLHELLISEGGEGLEGGQGGVAGAAIHDARERALDYLDKPGGAERREQR